MLRALKRLFNDEPVDPTLWHKWWKTLPVRLTDGRLSSPVGQLWRRRGSNGWEYRQDAETDDQWLERQI